MADEILVKLLSSKDRGDNLIALLHIFSDIPHRTDCISCCRKIIKFNLPTDVFHKYFWGITAASFRFSHWPELHTI